MPQYLVAVHHPDNFDPSTESAATVRDIDALNEEMAAAGVVIFVGGLNSVREAKSLRAQPDGKVLTTDGHTWRPRSTSPVFGCWRSLTWTRRWRGGARR
ncbi:MAG: hypothetical protein WAN14_03580 [Candidatus Acidiferrales bacterium]